MHPATWANLPPVEQLRDELGRGGRFVRYHYCISIIVLTMRRRSRKFYLPPGEKACHEGLRYSVISLLAGWWGIPFGPIFTILSVLRNIEGEDATHEVVDAFSRQGVYLEQPLKFLKKTADAP